MRALNIKNLVFFIGAASSILIAIQKVELAVAADSVYISSPDVEVRSAPSNEGQALAAPKKDTELKVLELWYKVKLPDGRQGWVDGRSVTTSRLDEKVSEGLAVIKAMLDSYVVHQRQTTVKFMNLLDGEIDTDSKLLPRRIKLPTAKQSFLILPTLEEKIEVIRKSIFTSVFTVDLEKIDSIKKEIDEKQKSIRPYLKESVIVSNEEMRIEILPFDRMPASTP